MIEDKKNDEMVVYTDYSEFLEKASAVFLQELVMVKDEERSKIVEIAGHIELSKIAHGRTMKTIENMVVSNSAEIVSYLVSCIFLMRTVIGVEEYNNFVKVLEKSATTSTEFNKNNIDEADFNLFLRTKEWYVALILMRMFAAKLIAVTGKKVQ
jgi:hypothetical protein